MKTNGWSESVRYLTAARCRSSTGAYLEGAARADPDQSRGRRSPPAQWPWHDCLVCRALLTSCNLRCPCSSLGLLNFFSKNKPLRSPHKKQPQGRKGGAMYSQPVLTNQLFVKTQVAYNFCVMCTACGWTPNHLTRIIFICVRGTSSCTFRTKPGTRCTPSPEMYLPSLGTAFLM